jgi:hypothetical protein
MFKTGAYGKSENKHNKSKQTYNTTKEKEKTTFKKEKRKSSTKNNKASKKPSKAEMERRKKEGACFYCGEQGHMANDCPKKDIKTNRVAEDSESEDEEEEEDSGDEQSSTEEVFVGMILHSVKTTATTENNTTPFQALEANININGHQARVLFDTGTIGTDLLSNRFISTHNIPYELLTKPRTLKMADKGSRSLANYKASVILEIGKYKFTPAPMMVTTLDTYDALIGFNFLHQNGAVIDCGKNSIYFPKAKLRIICTPKSTQLRSAMTHNEEHFDAPSKFPTVFVDTVPEILPPLRQINHRIRIKDPELTINMPQYKIGHNLLPKLKQ